METGHPGSQKLPRPAYWWDRAENKDRIAILVVAISLLLEVRQLWIISALLHLPIYGGES